MDAVHDYSMIRDFITKFLPSGFRNISRAEPFIVELEQQLRRGQQFFYVGDVLHLKILFVTSGSQDIIGVGPDQWDLSTFIERVHPDDMERFIKQRVQLIKTGYELSTKRQGTSFLSTHFKIKNSSGEYVNLLFQGYSFYCDAPYQTVFLVLLFTDLAAFKLDPQGYHYYEGNDATCFRYPDNALLAVGHLFSDREFEIIKLIALGYGSEQIADKLKLSVNTINTHRRNILKKTKSSTTHGLIIELQERGIL